MALVVCNNGEGVALSYLVNKSTPENLVLKLFKSNTTPSETDTAGTFTEATFTGYSSITLTGSSWGSPATGAPSSITYGSQQTFTASAGSQTDDIYGYYIIRATSTDLVWAERDGAAPFAIRNNGDNIKITPVITAD